LNFVVAYEFMVANTFFRKKKSYLITFNSGHHSSQLDFILTRREERPNCMDCKITSGECVVTQYKLLIVDFHFQVHVQRDRVFVEGSWNAEDVDNIWDEMSTHMQKVEVFGVTRGNKCEPKNTWW
jgi:hypothetical protein